MKRKDKGLRKGMLCLALIGILGFALLLGGCSKPKGSGEGGSGAGRKEKYAASPARLETYSPARFFIYDHLDLSFLRLC